MRASIASIQAILALLLWDTLATHEAKQYTSGPRTFDDLKRELDIRGYRGADQVPSSNAILGQDNNVKRGCPSTCTILGAILPNNTFQQNTSSYNAQEAAYWSNQQAETHPICRIQPASAKEMSASLLITKFFKCPFAVKSGGHAAFANASNIEGGLTIDLARLNRIQVSPDNTTTQLGAGNRWGDVYSHLDPLGLSVVGGRVADIGVGGLTLGGGVSFFSGRHGWACDGVRNYQVVLADTTIVDVSQFSRPDLYFALRGGGNNFGIVTRFDLETFPQGNLWGGMRFHAPATFPSLLTALNNFAIANLGDLDAALIVAFALFNGSYTASTDLEYAKPVPNPPVFKEFLGVQSVSSTLRLTSLTDLATELKAVNPSGFREIYMTATFKVSTQLTTKILEIWKDEVERIKDAAGILPALVLQPITKRVIEKFGKNGGNALGIAEGDGPLILMNIAILWSSPSDDARITAAATSIINRSVETSKKMKFDYKYIYQNYAYKTQDVFASYGAKNHERLRRISRKYDPEQIFQKLQPGYFKLRA